MRKFGLLFPRCRASANLASSSFIDDRVDVQAISDDDPASRRRRFINSPFRNPRPPAPNRSLPPPPFTEESLNEIGEFFPESSCVSPYGRKLATSRATSHLYDLSFLGKMELRKLTDCPTAGELGGARVIPNEATLVMSRCLAITMRLAMWMMNSSRVRLDLTPLPV